MSVRTASSTGVHHHKKLQRDLEIQTTGSCLITDPSRAAITCRILTTFSDFDKKNDLKDLQGSDPPVPLRGLAGGTALLGSTLRTPR